jgi:hypothetical protein
MKAKLLLIVSVLVIVVVVPLVFTQLSATQSEVYVGIDVAYDIADPNTLIDKVSEYTNFFVVGCTAISQNQTRLNNICQYLYEKKMHFIVYQDISLGYFTLNGSLISQARPQNTTNPSLPAATRNFTVPNQPRNLTRPTFATIVSNWTQMAKERWGSQFMGFYFTDELAGKQLDMAPGWVEVRNATDFADAANQFNQSVSRAIEWFHRGYTDWRGLSLFSSDYALYQFDYDVGYDVMLAQLGWNYSRQLNIALCRGAATTSSKDWGVIVTWEYNQAPFAESGSQLYDDMVLAYNNGAKYITVFDSNKDYNASILTEDHYNAIKDFWQYVKEHPRPNIKTYERVAYVLPVGYGYGFRGPTDSIWGLWPADAFSTKLSTNIGNALTQYGDNLDIVYNQTILDQVGYHELIYWNSELS